MTPPTPDIVAEFRSRQGAYTAMRDRRILLDKRAMVSKKNSGRGLESGIHGAGGAHDAEDSGWFFASGTEDQGYLDDCHNIQLLPVGVVWQQLDRDISHTLTARWALG